MIDCLIFSKNRPAQLDLLLRSIERYAPTVFNHIAVLTPPNDPACVPTRPGRISHVLESPLGFERSVRCIVGYGAPAVCFLVDDDVIFRAPKRVTGLPFSLRTGEYDYFFTLDGGIYERGFVSLQLDFNFANPTQLEAGVANSVAHMEIPYHYACLVGIPANRVSESSGMAHMGQDVEELNARYAEGWRIDLDKVVAQVDPAGDPHQEIVYEWRRA